MFTLSTSGSIYRHHLYDLDTLEDVLIGLIDDEPEAKRIAGIAGNMKIGDVFSNKDVYLKCRDELKEFYS